jgi:thymidine kinase
MAKLYFYYSAMNAGKSTMLLQSSFNYQERGMDTLVFTPALDSRFGNSTVASRIGISAEAISFDKNMNLFDFTAHYLSEHSALKCVLIDEAQFLLKKQVLQLSEVVDKLNLPVLCFGLRSDFQGEPFEGSLYLLVLADEIIEIKTICFCGKKAIMNSRIDDEGRVVRVGEQILIGGNQHYIATCRKHFKEIDHFPTFKERI